MRLILSIALTMILSGCLTLGGNREIRSTPSGALVTLPGFGECETPCTIKLDRTRRITIAKAGYKQRLVDIEPGGGPVTIPLELAAPTADVDSQTLPDLD